MPLPPPTANGDFYVLDPQGANKIAHIRFEPPVRRRRARPVQVCYSPGTIQDSDTKATPVGNLTATLHTRVNPEGRSTTVHFEYVDDTEFQANGFANAVRTPESDPIGSGFSILPTPKPSTSPAPDPGSPAASFPTPSTAGAGV